MGTASDVKQESIIYIYIISQRWDLHSSPRLHRGMHTASTPQEASTKASYDRLIVKAPQYINTRMAFLPLNFI